MQRCIGAIAPAQPRFIPIQPVAAGPLRGLRDLAGAGLAIGFLAAPMVAFQPPFHKGPYGSGPTGDTCSQRLWHLRLNGRG